MARHGAELLPELPASLARAFETYLNSLRFERGLSRNSIDAYARDLARYGTWLNGQGMSHLGEVERTHVEAFALHLLDENLAPRTRARALVAVRRFHGFALGEGLAATDPASEVSPPQEGLRLPKALSLDDIEAMLATTGGEEPSQIRAAALLELLYATGARISEAVGVYLDDLDLETSLVRLYGKGGKERIVPFGSHAATALGAWVSRTRPSMAAKARSSAPAGPCSSTPGELASHARPRGRSSRTPGNWRGWRPRCHRIRSDTRLRHTCSKAGPISALSKNCWDTPQSRPRRSTPRCRRKHCGKCTRPRTLGRGRVGPESNERWPSE